VTDVFTRAKRSEVMSRIRGRDTRPERAVRSLLHRRGYRFRLHVATLPGRPDIVMPKYRVVILVHGCFWHRHPRCRFSYSPKTRVEFWQKKFSANQRRDRHVESALEKLGWSVITVWECQIRDSETLAARLSSELTRAALVPATRAR
jgi:DNA mismatch endonuclease (patch repair protein)